MGKSTKVLHIIKSLGRGGAERLLAETTLHHSNEFQFDVVYFLPWKNQMVPDLEKVGCRVHLLPASNSLYMVLRIPKLIKLLRSQRYDLIHCHLPWAGIVGRIAGRIVGIPVIYTEHNNFFTYQFITRFVHKSMIGLFDQIITVSHDAEKALRKAVGMRFSIETILNGVDTDKFNRALYDVSKQKMELGMPPQAFIVSTVAVFREQKKLIDWLDIAKKILSRNNNFYFIIVGDGPQKKLLRDRANQLGLQDQLRFVGLVEDPRPWLACSDVYLMCSSFEGLPVALLEAMSMKCVPVVTSVGGIPSVVNSDNGYLFEPGRMDQAVDIVLKSFEDTTKLKSLAEQARVAIQTHYSISRMVNQIENIYKTKVLHSIK